MSLVDRVHNPVLKSRIMSAEAAAELIPAGANVGMSGFTGAGYPKTVPQALARRIERLHAAGEAFRIGLWTGASTAPELDGALAKVDGIEMRLPYQSDPTVRKQINAGQMQYTDIHLSNVAQHVWFGFLGHLDVAVVEVAGILPDGRLIPSSSVGNNKTWLDQADKIILEVNSMQNAGLEGMHDVYYGTQLPPHRLPIPLTQAGERIQKAAVDAIIAATQGYPFFLQAWAYHSWNEAEASPITKAHVAAAHIKVLQNLDGSFFRMRFERLTPSEKRYLRAMAELGPGPHRSGDIADILGVKVTSIAPVRGNLIAKGMIHAPAHGDTAFTVPLFDDFMKRQMPVLEVR